MLTQEQCQTLYPLQKGQFVFLRYLAINDGRLGLFREDGEMLCCWMDAEWLQEEQAQAARLCACLNNTLDKAWNHENNSK